MRPLFICGETSTKGIGNFNKLFFQKFSEDVSTLCYSSQNEFACVFLLCKRNKSRCTPQIYETTRGTNGKIRIDRIPEENSKVTLHQKGWSLFVGFG